MFNNFIVFVCLGVRFFPARYMLNVFLGSLFFVSHLSALVLRRMENFLLRQTKKEVEIIVLHFSLRHDRWWQVLLLVGVCEMLEIEWMKAAEDRYWVIFLNRIGIPTLVVGAPCTTWKHDSCKRINFRSINFSWTN